MLDSGERHAHASGGYNERRAECARAGELLGVQWLSQADAAAVERLPEPLRRRARHVLSENARVRDAIDALREADMPALGRLLDASHASLREDFQISTPAVEATVARLNDAGAAGARLMGGGFGGCVLALFAPGAQPPRGRDRGAPRTRRAPARELSCSRRAAGQRGAHRRAASSAQAVSTTASDSAASAPSSGASRRASVSCSLLPSARVRTPDTELVRRRSSRAGELR